MTSTNITSYLLNTSNKLKAKMGFNPTATTAMTATTATTANTSYVSYNTANVGSSILRIATYVGGIIVVALIIFIFIHFFITPIFSFHPGAPGIIVIPGFDDGKLYWEKGNAGQIVNTLTPIEPQCHSYSMIVDMFIQNPFQFSTYPRILFSRGASERNNPPKGNTIIGVVPNYNLVIALLPDTTDLIVSVLDATNNSENVILSNIPTQEPFRLGIIIMEKALEVYMNGKLIKTRAFDAPPKSVVGDINIASNVESNIAKMRNLKIWNRVLTTSEIRNATPSMSTAKDFDASTIPTTSTSCGSGSGSNSALNTIEELSSSISDIRKLYKS